MLDLYRKAPGSLTGAQLRDAPGGADMDAAFDRLRGYARTHNTRLSEVARPVIETNLAAEMLCAPAVGDRVADQR